MVKTKPIAFILALALVGCESPKSVTVRRVNPSPVSSEPEITYAVVRWTVRSNGVLIAGVPSVVSYSTNLRDWQRIATNTTGNITVATDADANFFKVQPL